MGQTSSHKQKDEYYTRCPVCNGNHDASSCNERVVQQVLLKQNADIQEKYKKFEEIQKQIDELKLEKENSNQATIKEIVQSKDVLGEPKTKNSFLGARKIASTSSDVHQTTSNPSISQREMNTKTTYLTGTTSKINTPLQQTAPAPARTPTPSLPAQQPAPTPPPLQHQPIPAPQFIPPPFHHQYPPTTALMGNNQQQPFMPNQQQAMPNPFIPLPFGNMNPLNNPYLMIPKNQNTQGQCNPTLRGYERDNQNRNNSFDKFQHQPVQFNSFTNNDYNRYNQPPNHNQTSQYTSECKINNNKNTGGNNQRGKPQDNNRGGARRGNWNNRGGQSRDRNDRNNYNGNHNNNFRGRGYGRGGSNRGRGLFSGGRAVQSQSQNDNDSSNNDQRPNENKFPNKNGAIPKERKPNGDNHQQNRDKSQNRQKREGSGNENRQGNVNHDGNERNKNFDSDNNGKDTYDRKVFTNNEFRQRKNHQGVQRGGIQKDRQRGRPWRKCNGRQGAFCNDLDDDNQSSDSSTGFETCVGEDLRKINKNHSKLLQQQETPDNGNNNKKPLSATNMGEGDLLLKYIGKNIPSIAEAIDDPVSLFQPVEGIMLVSDPNLEEPECVLATTLMHIIEFKNKHPNAISFFLNNSQI